VSGPPPCAGCGSPIEVDAATAARYPGWTPRECRRCYRRARGGRRGEGSRTTAEVLAAHDAGPADGVFTDGSASPNPGPGGWGAVYVVDGQVVDERHGHDPATTNNRMELVALREGIALVPPGTPATVYSDSRLVVDTLTSWAPGWAARGWRRKGGEIANLDLVRPLYEAVSARPELEVRWIRAHAGNRWNEYADALATTWMRAGGGAGGG
jgi:ribonuclease HI